MTKSIFSSRTVWVALLILIGSILNITGTVKLDVSPDASWVGIALSLIQIVLRLITKEPIDFSKDTGKGGGGFSTPLFLIALCLLPALLISGCCSKVVQKDVVQDKKISITVPGQNYQMPATEGNLTETQYRAYDTTFKSLPDSAYVLAKNGRITAKYYLKKKSSMYLPVRSWRTQQLRIQYSNSFSRLKILRC